MLSFLAQYDVILCPVDPYPAWPHGFTAQEGFPPEGVTAYTKPFSMAGWPSVVVRAGSTVEGLPIGVQVVAGPWREDLALVVAQAIEAALGGWQQPRL
jgi:amidase